MSLTWSSNKQKYVVYGYKLIKGMFYASLWSIVMWLVIYFVLVNSSLYKP